MTEATEVAARNPAEVILAEIQGLRSRVEMLEAQVAAIGDWSAQVVQQMDHLDGKIEGVALVIRPGGAVKAAPKKS